MTRWNHRLAARANEATMDYLVVGTPHFGGYSSIEYQTNDLGEAESQKLQLGKDPRSSSYSFEVIRKEEWAKICGWEGV